MATGNSNTPGTTRPLEPLFQRVLAPIQAFFAFEAAGGVLLLGATVIALAWANSPLGDLYEHLFHLPLSLGIGETRFDFTVHHLINDGLMAIFFFVVGMEIKRELVVGELRTVQRALLPAVAAVGGMVVPALIYVAFNWGTPAMRGWAIPMATDIAFAIGLVTVLKDRTPWGLIVFLTALAIFDDMGGIAVIALFYGTGIKVSWLLVTVAFTLIGVVLGRLHVRNGMVWALGGALLWYSLHHAGIHATISGVILGFLIPARARHAGREVLQSLYDYLQGIVGRPQEEDVSNEEVLQIEERLEDLEPPLNRFIHALHPYVAFFIVPLFALANAGVDVRSTPLSALLDPVPAGIALGLFVGKQAGIFLFTWVYARATGASIPGQGTAKALWGVSLVAGIGFTVALFVAGLAFADDPHLLAEAKLGILVGSFASAIAGFVVLRLSRKLAGPGREVASAQSA